MRPYTERTNVEDLEKTVLLGLKTQPTCLVSVRRLGECLRGMDEDQRAKWQREFCRAERLSAETVERGILFTRTAAQDADADL